VTDNDGCTSLDSTLVVVHPLPIIITGFSSQLLCKGDSLALTSSGGTGYSWKPNAALSDSTIANPIAAPQVSTKYRVVVTTGFACIDSAVVDIMVVEKPQANAGPDKVAAQGTTVPLLGMASGGIMAWTPSTWFIDNPLLAQPMVRPPADTAYILTVTSANGCGVASDTVRVFIFKGLAIPSAFSPNGDGLNDSWNIAALSMFSTFELSVFNRYGQTVFQTKNMLKPWDGRYKGKLLSGGTYVYLIQINQYPYTIKGYVTIIQ
jgi:gliding motility-associated-like protein